MTYPAGIDPELVGTTKPEVLALALSGHLAAAAGGENQIPQAVAEQTVGEAFLAMQDESGDAGVTEGGPDNPTTDQTPTDPALASGTADSTTSTSKPK